MNTSEDQKRLLEAMLKAFALQESSEKMRIERVPTLRDQFAMAAITGCTVSGKRPEWLAEHAYEVADAMLKERER